MITSCTDIHNLAHNFAPIIFHDLDEHNFPTNVDLFLGKTSLWVLDYTSGQIKTTKIIDHPTQADLVNQRFNLPQNPIMKIISSGTRSMRKKLSFFIADVDLQDRLGSIEPVEWTTYYHYYENQFGGYTIQYWRFYAYNSGKKVKNYIGLPLDMQLGFHGGDWEAVSITFDEFNVPRLVYLFEHDKIKTMRWNDIGREEDHICVFSEKGGHATFASGSFNGIRQETWGGEAGAKVNWPGRGTFSSGRLVCIGEKIAPQNGQIFIKYSGLWGSPSSFKDPDTVFYYISSGYWGPAYNETNMREDGFISAWGENARDPKRCLEGIKEYYPDATCP